MQYIPFSVKTELNLAQRAARNARIIRWFSNCEPITHNQLRLDYAAFLGCDMSELGDTLGEFVQDTDVLDWIAMRYPMTIEGTQ